MDALALRLCEVFLSLRVKICLRLRRHLRANKGLSSCASSPFIYFPSLCPSRVLFALRRRCRSRTDPTAPLPSAAFPLFEGSIPRPSD